VGELTALWQELGSWPWPVVAFESPQRLPKTLRSLAEVTPQRQVAVCRELTKRFEEVVRGEAAELAVRFADPPKGEITLVLGPAAGGLEGAVDDAETAVAELVAAGTPRRVAVDVIARLAGVARNELYRRTL
jgi:16S rRNA (cytidine1402-2'-O)-methyltransferase